MYMLRKFYEYIPKVNFFKVRNHNTLPYMVRQTQDLGLLFSKLMFSGKVWYFIYILLPSVYE